MAVFSQKINIALFGITAIMLLVAAWVWCFKPFTVAPPNAYYRRPLLCSGTYDFIVSTSDHARAFIQEGSIAPCDPEKQTIQNITLTTVPETTHVEGRINTDTKTTHVTFTKTGDNPKKWRGAWIHDDTYDHTYTITLMGDISGETQQIPITFR